MAPKTKVLTNEYLETCLRVITVFLDATNSNATLMGKKLLAKIGDAGAKANCFLSC
jgi:hypothetical protein